MNNTIKLSEGERELISKFMGYKVGKIMDFDSAEIIIEKIESCKNWYFYGFNVKIRKKYCVIYCQDGVIHQTSPRFTPEPKLHAIKISIIDFISNFNKS